MLLCLIALQSASCVIEKPLTFRNTVELNFASVLFTFLKSFIDEGISLPLKPGIFCSQWGRSGSETVVLMLKMSRRWESLILSLSLFVFIPENVFSHKNVEPNKFNIS